MFDATDPTNPRHDGSIDGDLDTVLASWVGGRLTITVIDVSGIARQALGIVVGTMVRLIL